MLGQDHKEVQLIVVNDGSTDGTAAVIASFDDPRLHLVDVPNGGVSRARNAGLSMARGSTIAFLDADDYWLAAKLSRQLRVMSLTPNLAAVGSYMRYVSRTDEALGTTGQHVGPAELLQLRRAELMPFALSSILWRTKLVQHAGGFDENLPDVEDLDLLARIAHLGPVECVPDVLGAYRIHKDSASAVQAKRQRAATRFVRARLQSGGNLTWEEFSREYKLTWRQSYGDQVQRWYRSAGVNVAERRFASAVGYSLLAFLAGPRYSIRRLVRQRGVAR